MTDLPIERGSLSLRRWCDSDVSALVVEANTRVVWRNMIDSSPHPYTREDAISWVTRCQEQDPPQDLVLARNPASARVLEKNGFRLEGTRRRAIFKDGELIDESMYTLFRSRLSRQ